MKRSKINLIIDRDNYQKYEKFFYYFKLFFYCLMIVFFLTFFIFFFLINKKNQTTNQLNQRKKALLEVLKEKQGDEVKMYYIQQKYNDLVDFYKEDVFTLTYYQLLTQALKQSSEEATLKSFDISKNRDVSFIISFSDFPKMMSFFKFIESSIFLKNFEQISLKSFSVLGNEVDKKENYELSFVGKFIQVKTNINL
ncbi:hypothetical protein COW98_01185 [Candidatus Roizmanbacteria bacterium CG22_combo_CG10-13_8_21_14_all_35_9]|uniref:Uncharacterized protein n=4 Tax=Candidatus Roizmaniibacteriota TaxID=1752723 RepID=A0A2M8F2I4_9BACT|nr:MAG: hypothetical protein COX47_01335 [Candidatus Roizmanbacteria bacterium CG23_combo_of_CG06-09_8_20_14_all_35_49]PIP62953.1 MAG: hypothetical protein COW98_01185 [Candidatus Roizmanbacteria bacterium CG22_combo_CG10-13_8_21_14_all_35_9]PIY70808.1 MAG: hypothetical protein COY88_03555 [Candidatus Roizmanbacteria bacterium CG_4_10_14_0_8_um_filter_35_28]PJC33478.1 MAG: hypothetical protein CO048_03020 [Candidatus Roizmanbacteria bacterium CG_4_9_14_0_2_um_filter_35_15]PJC82500.1 MAG: hypoth